jgi:hypothetical protein
MSNSARVVVLAEDSCHQRFARRYLERLGYQGNEIRFLPLPSGRGCGEQFVRNKYPEEVQDHRRRAARSQKALVVLIDADTQTVIRRQTDLREELTSAHLEPRGEAERIVHLIPKRNIETWILCLTGDTVDEDTDYRHDKTIGPRIAPAAATFFDWSRPNATTPSQCLPSLTAAVPEIRRLA